MHHSEIIGWLLEGDVSIQYQVHRDLLSNDRRDLQRRIAREGFGRKFLSKRHVEGHWGDRFYQPKWISTHYTLLDLRNLCIDPNNKPVRASIDLILEHEKAKDGGVGPFGAERLSDLCVNGMFLNYASYFKTDEEPLQSIVDCILDQPMPDGGFNCNANRWPCRHSSLHTTISVLEGITEYQLNGYQYRVADLERAKQSGVEFILIHQLFKSDRTGKIINKDFLKMPYPCRWRYDILRALDYFQHAGIAWDDRMGAAMEVILKKRKQNGLWNVNAKYSGQVHFDMEQAGKPSRWNTLRAMRVLKHFNIPIEGMGVGHLAS